MQALLETEKQMNNSHNNNNYYSLMTDVYPNITNTELWKYLENETGMNFANDISRVCYDACTISGTITELLPNFTKHDSTHIKSVLDWMAILLENKLDILTKEETALLIMSACCHDVGMSISKDNKKELMNELETERLGRDLKEYFRKNKDKENEYKNRNKQNNNKELYKLIIRDFVRQNHHLRVEEVLGKETFKGLQGPLRKELVIALCKSHGEDLCELKNRIDITGVRIYLLAILLRLADILNFDTSRAPDIKFSHAGLDNPQSDEEVKSANEHIKNQICQWTISNDVVVCTGECPNNQLMHDVLYYVEWVRKEVESSNKLLNEINSCNNPLIIKQVKTNLSGDFLTGDYKLTVNTKRVIELLGSENVYGDSRAFLTELIQNSIDAILVRTNIDRSFSVENGKIDVCIWEDNDYIWTRVDDNGFGMDEEILMNYFLTVGESYYNSYDYKKIQREGSNAFTPLNRFGIGILSCFMNQSDVQLEVETRNINNENVYRMDVTSLDGYYSLYKLDRTNKCAPMSAPPFVSNITDGYSRDFGTTICVKQKKTGDDYSVEKYKVFIDEHISLPIVEFNLFTCDETKNFTTKNVFINSIERLMNGQKYKNLYDHLEIFCLDSLDNYIVPFRHRKSLDESKLKEAKVVVIGIHDLLRAQIEDMKYKVSSLSDGIYYLDYKKRAAMILKEWFIENKTIFDQNESTIIKHSIDSFMKEAGAHLTYNGISIVLGNIDRESFVYYIVDGSWFKKVNLSKTELLGLSGEVNLLYYAAKSLKSFHSNYRNMPYEVFEAIEQKVLDSNQDYAQKGYISFVINLFGYRDIEYSLFRGLSYIYNLHIELSGKGKETLNIRFSKEDRISREDSKFRFNLFRYPVCAFENDSTTLLFNGILNFNYPLIKWILSNCKKFTSEQYEYLYYFSNVFEAPKGYPNLFEYFYSILDRLKDTGCDYFDNEILQYMESIKDKSGGPIIIENKNKGRRHDN